LGWSQENRRGKKGEIEVKRGRREKEEGEGGVESIEGQGKSRGRKPLGRWKIQDGGLVSGKERGERHEVGGGSERSDDGGGRKKNNEIWGKTSIKKKKSLN